MGALDGIRVLDLSRLLPGPYCSMVLGDHGAEVIVLESRRFEKDDLYFSDVYRNKKHMALDLKSDAGKKIFIQLAEKADIIIEGFRPGVAKRLGVDYDTVNKFNPRIIYCSISGYGQIGEMSQHAGHDVNYLSRAGVLDLIGEREKPPCIPGVQIADIAGSMNGVVGVLLALHERNSSGKGQYIDISMTDSLLGFLTLPLHLAKRSGAIPKRSSSVFSHLYACYNTYETSDGRFFAIGAVEHRFWHNLCNVLGLPELSSLQYNNDMREEVTAKLKSLFKTETLKHWQGLLVEADVCFSVIQDIDEVLNDPLFLERQMIVEQKGETGQNKTFGVPVKLNRTPGALRSAPTPFGGAAEEVLTDLGYGREEIQDFFDKGIV